MGRNIYTKRMSEGTCLSRMMGILKWELEIVRVRTEYVRLHEEMGSNRAALKDEKGLYRR